MSLIDNIKDWLGRKSSSKDNSQLKPQKSKENYIENKNDALNKICNHLSRYSYSSDKNLAILHLWIITPENDNQIAWADSNFQKELKSRLHQEIIDAVKTIEITALTLYDFNQIKEQDASIQTMVESRLYYKTYAMSQQTSINTKKIPKAWLVCIEGQEYIQKKIIPLNPDVQKVWNIGRSEKPSVIDCNDVVIKDNCKDISRQQAAIVIDDGLYFLKCKEGGCRARGGKVTKIIRANGSQEELASLSHKILPHLNEGDVIQLSKSVYLRFTLAEPENVNINSALYEDR